MRRLKFRGGSSAVDTTLIDELVAFVEHRIEDRVFEQFIYRHDTLEDLLGPDLYMVAISIRWNHPPAVDAVRNRLARLLEGWGVPFDRAGGLQRKMGKHERVLNDLAAQFPKFAKRASSKRARLTQFLPPVSEAELSSIETRIGVRLPPSYRAFLQITHGFEALGDTLKLTATHPRKHPGLVGSPSVVTVADWWLEADGDEALFVVDGGRDDGEWPVAYYGHADPRIEIVCESFGAWLEKVLVWRSR